MKRKPKTLKADMTSVSSKGLERLVALNENYIIMALALKNVPYKIIREVIGCQMTRITEFLKPVRKEIDKFIKDKKSQKEE